MKMTCALIILGSVSALTASPYNDCPSCNGGNRNYQDGQGYNQGNSNYQQGQGYNQGNSNYQQGQGYNQGNRNSQDGQGYNQGNRNYNGQANDGYQNNEQRNSANNSWSNNNQNTSDQDINKKVRDALSSGWFSKGYQDVTFDVNNGVVNLRGYVDTLDNKNKAEEAVKKIEGVNSVNNQIIVSTKPDSSGNSGSKGYSDADLQKSEQKFPQDAAANQDDRQLNAKIRDKLNNGWFSSGYETLILRTSNGIVVISGTVDKDADVQKIGDQVKNVDGVRTVNNQLSVKNK